MVFAHDGKGVESGVRGSIVLIRRICEARVSGMQTETKK